MNAETKQCQNCRQDFVIEPDDFTFYEKMQVPPPTFCSQCRLQRRLSWRNERILFRRKDNSNDTEMIAGFPADVPFPVYNNTYWWSDSWDPMQYGRDYDFNRTFFEQFRDLMNVVPWSGRSVINVVNSDYSDQAGHIKNCYLCFNCDYVENCTYIVRANNVKENIDTLHTQFSELLYESVMIDKSFRTFFSVLCEGSTDMWFSKQCVGCNNCFGCVNLRNKSYHIWNKPYSKEEYIKKLEELNLGSYRALETLKTQAHEFWKQFPVKYLRGVRNVNSNGDMLGDTKNVRQSFSIQQGQNIRYSQFLYLNTTEAYDYSVWGNHASQIYECLTCGEEVDQLKFCFDCWPSSRNLEYCISCHSTSDCFGCVGLKKKQYCILNKQYSKEEYSLLVSKIKKHMDDMPYVSPKGQIYKYGEFFPSEFSPLAYNETMLQDAFPLDKDEALKKGYRWRDPNRREYEATLSFNALPDNIRDVNDNILKEIIECSSCNRAYRIIQAELDFLKRIGIPLPRSCPDCRVKRRFGFLNQPLFTKQKCQCAGKMDNSSIYTNTILHAHTTDHCSNEFETSYPSNSSAIIYCEECYQQEII